jgi:lipopolysaccharide/colanic/teichoic acid biosynthesis glycosyltransferase
MEPDISAIPSIPVAGPNGQPPANEAFLAMLAVEALDAHRNGDATARSTGNGTANGNGHANGRAHVNGHATVNGHSNGYANGHAHVATNGHAATHAPIAARWSATVQPLPATTVSGAYEATHAVTPEPRGFYLRAGKRAVDVMVSVVALIVTAPVMLLAAIAIKLESRGPIFYRSTRVGRRGRPFVFYKLRSMEDGADRRRHHLTHLNECDGPVFKMSNDPRVTRIGRFLRTTSLDEVPQFFNVLRGEMSLVGPRPPIPEEVAHYQPWAMRRLDVRPGLTCLWQISGRSRIGFEEWMRLDLEYIRCQSARMDLTILLRTIPAVLSREGAY